MDSNDALTAHPTVCCHKTRLKGARCPLGFACPHDPVACAVAGVTLTPVQHLGPLANALNPKPQRDLTADYMALAGSHMATTKVLARLAAASRRYVGEPSAVRAGSLMEAIHAAEKDLGL